MSNMYEDPIYDEVGTSYDSSIPSKVQDQDNYLDNVDEYYQEHEMQSDVQHYYVVNSDADYTSDSNIILYDQYMEDNEEHVVQSNVSSTQNEAFDVDYSDRKNRDSNVELEKLKAQLTSKVSSVTSDSIKPKVLAPGMYAIDVKHIPPLLKNNRSAHLNYINLLKESVKTVREIVEQARVVKPLDNALNYACQYTKLSQELLEYVICICPKEFNTKDNKAASTPLTSNTHDMIVQQKVQQSNVPVIPSTRVSSSTDASISKPRSNTKKNRILPAKRKDNKVKTEQKQAKTDKKRKRQVQEKKLKRYQAD
ncbi:hypothetical protein Tco_1493008 [Tanacetum coccineum]